MKKITLLFLFLSVCYVDAQVLTLTYTDSSIKQVEGTLIYDDDGLIHEIKTSNKTNVSLQDISFIAAPPNKRYAVKKYKNGFYAFEILIDNTLSLYRSKQKYFLENDEIQIKEISFKEKNGYNFHVFDTGMLSVFINKCKASQNYIHKNFNKINVSRLRIVVNKYNTCDLNENIQVSDQSIENAILPKEKIFFGIALGNSLFKADYTGISINNTQEHSLLNIGGTLHFRPNILNKKLFYKLTVNYLVKSEEKFLALDSRISTKHAYLETALGMNFLLLKEESNFNPYIGVSGGFLFNNGSNVTIVSNVFGQPAINYTSTSKLMYTINAGLLLNVFKQHIDVNMSYLPETKFELATSSLGLNKSYHTLKGVSLRLSYLF